MCSSACSCGHARERASTAKKPAVRRALRSTTTSTRACACLRSCRRSSCPSPSSPASTVSERPGRAARSRAAAQLCIAFALHLRPERRLQEPAGARAACLHARDTRRCCVCRSLAQAPTSTASSPRSTGATATITSWPFAAPSRSFSCCSCARWACGVATEGDAWRRQGASLQRRRAVCVEPRAQEAA